jgi:hypothetical protein
MIRFACSLAIVACFTLPAVADIPPPPPAKGFKRVPYENIMKLEAELPGYKFGGWEKSQALDAKVAAAGVEEVSRSRSTR